MRNRILFFALLLSSFGVQARLSTPDEAPFSFESLTATIEVPDNGHARETWGVDLKALNDEGRLGMGTARFEYSPEREKLSISHASITTDGTTISLPDDSIEDKVVRAMEYGFDDSRQVMIAFPHVQVGSEIKYQIFSEVLRPVVKDQFDQRIVIGDKQLIKNADYDITSTRPLYFDVQDPTHALEITKEENGKKNHYHIHLKKPVYHQVFDEMLSIEDYKGLTWFAISTSKDYQSLFQPLAKQYEEVLSKPLPHQFEKLRDEMLKSKETPVAKLEKVLADFADQIRYMGDWRSIDGGYIPRAMEKVSETRSGDCKDMATLTTKILRSMGFDAWPALVNRGETAQPLPKTAYMGFNHAIVYVKLDDKNLWLDPTNSQSFPLGVFADIADREALVLDPKKIAVKKIELPPASSSKEVVQLKMYPKKNTVRMEMTWDQTGSMALPSTGAFLRASKEQYEESTISSITRHGDVLNHHMEAPDLSSRIVKPIQTKIQWEEPFRFTETSMGKALNLSPPGFVEDISNIDTAKRASDIKLGVPYISESTEDFPGIKPIGDQLKNCSVSSRWLDYSFSISKKPLTVKMKAITKQFSIPVEDIKSKEFIGFQKKLKDCAVNKYLIFTR